MAADRRDTDAGSDTDRRFWRQVADVTESTIEPPADGWQKISRRLDAEQAANTDEQPPERPAGGVRLPGLLVWLLGLLVISALYVVVRQTQPAPDAFVQLQPAPVVTSGPVDSGTRKMRIDWLRPPINVSVKDLRVHFDYRLVNTGSGRIVLPGAGTTSRHYFLSIRKGGVQLQSYPLVAAAADRLPANGGVRVIADLLSDQVLEPGDMVSVQTVADLSAVFGRGTGRYTVQIQYAPPASSEKSSPADTVSERLEITVVP